MNVNLATEQGAATTTWNKKLYMKEYNKKYRIKHKENISGYYKEYHIKNREEALKQMKEYRIKNKEKIKEYRIKNKVKIKEYRIKNKEHMKEYRNKNKEKISAHNKRYAMENPEKIFAKSLRHLKRNADKMGMRLPEYIYTIMAWAKTVKHKKICEICGSSEKLEAHHLLSKKNYPAFQFIVNNGITLCRMCHLHTEGKMLKTKGRI